EVDAAAIPLRRLVQHRRETLEGCCGIDLAGRVVRRVDDDGPCARRDGGGDGVDIEVERLPIDRDLHRRAAGVHDDQLIEEPRRQVDDDLVAGRSEEHTSALQSRENLVCRLLLEKKKTY